MQPLPLDILDFRELREKNALYVDKTELIYDLVTTRKACFLSRPRRFGKSLLLSTIKALFSEPTNQQVPAEKLFAGLWIGGSDYDFSQTHPVVSLSMAKSARTPEYFDSALRMTLQRRAAKDSLALDSGPPGEMFTDLIEKLMDRYDKKVVILID
jgi:hypothetical protein